MGFETTEEIMAEELEKQRRKLRDMTSTLEQQYHMLRLIVQVSFNVCFAYSPKYSSNKFKVHHKLLIYAELITENGN